MGFLGPLGPPWAPGLGWGTTFQTLGCRQDLGPLGPPKRPFCDGPFCDGPFWDSLSQSWRDRPPPAQVCWLGPETQGTPNHTFLPGNGSPSHHLGHGDRDPMQNSGPDIAVGVPGPVRIPIFVSTHVDPKIQSPDSENGFDFLRTATSKWACRRPHGAP